MPAEISDPAIKLFGKTIQVLTKKEIQAKEDVRSEGAANDKEFSHNSNSKDNSSTKERTHDHEHEDQEEPGDTGSSSEPKNNPTTNQDTTESPEQEDPINPQEVGGGEEENQELGIGQERTNKKPSKLLPCPRCNSLETKFCYYNNYNVNQPRHFCKSCQRYWTAGGTMRNVPVGAGRRKNKHSSSSHYRQIPSLTPDGLPTSCSNNYESSHIIQNGVAKPTGTVLSFGSDIPLCESVASVLNLAEHRVAATRRNGLIKAEEEKPQENGEDISCGSSSLTSTNSMDKEQNRVQFQDPNYATGFASGYSGAPWPYPWSPVQWSTPTIGSPAFCAPSIPLSFYHGSYWGCIPGGWPVPWVANGDGGLTSPTSLSNNSSLNSPTLGKHPRDRNLDNQSKTDSCLWVPKTLRIEDSGEAVNSSIWATLKANKEKVDTISGGGIFKAFHSKGDDKNRSSEASQVLHANPAALSRSHNFHENF
ncbi:hypothetical protein AMTRI_Chr04g190450 [Amborella trichopoda]